MHDLNNSLDSTVYYPRSGAMKRTLRGSAVSILGEGICALKNILLVPLFLYAWGAPQYGEWLVIYALLAYLTLADIGMQNYVVNSLTQAYCRRDLREYTKILHSALWLCLLIVILSISILAAFVYLVPFERWLNLSSQDTNVIKVTAFILGLYIICQIPIGLVSGLYHSMGEYSRRATLIIVREVFLIIVLALFLFLKTNFIMIASVHFIPLFCFIAYCIWDIKSNHPEITFGLSLADRRLILHFIGPSLLFLIIVLSNVLKIQGSILIISTFLGTGAVAIFSIHRTLANSIFRVVNSINCAIWPELTVSEARKDYQALQLAHALLIKFSLIISISFAILLFFIGRDIIKIWTQNKITFQPILWLFLLIYLPIDILWQTSGIFQVSSNRHKTYSFARVISAMLGIILAIILTKSWGIAGTLFGLIIPECIICGSIIPLKTLKIINLSKRIFLFDLIFKGFMLALIQMLAGWLIFVSIQTLNIFTQWILLGLWVFMLGGILSYLFWFNQQEKIRLKLLFSIII